jgi:pimeloyl-ACP methyl ester carboxylesterase
MQANTTQPLPQGQITTVNDMQMYYAVYGEGSPLVLLHGFTQTGAFWHPYIATFAEHFRLIVPDLRGHGRSTNPTNQFTHRQAALDIVALLEQLGIPLIALSVYIRQLVPSSSSSPLSKPTRMSHH